MIVSFYFLETFLVVDLGIEDWWAKELDCLVDEYWVLWLLDTMGACIKLR